MVEIFLGEMVGGVVDQSAQRRRFVAMNRDMRRETEAVVRLAEALVGSAPNQLRDWLAMAIGCVQVEIGVDGDPEWIHLPTRPILDSRDRPESHPLF